MTNKCYLSKNYKGLQNAGNKAKTDIEKILQQQGFRNVGLKQTVYTNKVLVFFITLLGVLKAPFCLHKGDVLLLQYPLKKYYSFVCNMAHLRGAKVITLIHDLGSFRRQKLTIPQEIKRLGHSDYIIAHNTFMKSWLEQQGCKIPIGCLEIFDYLSETTAPDRDLPPLPYGVVYAGGLSPRKNTFLYEIGETISNYHINLYGNGFEAEKAKGKEHFTYKGFVPSDQLIAKAEGDFGLVWDGDSITSCSGNWGEYLQYNNPHKTSLYIRCELPVIIWKKAALAPFIEKNKIGIPIDSLTELNERLKALNPEEYKQMKANIAIVSNRLSNGYYCTKAVEKALKTLL